MSWLNQAASYRRRVLQSPGNELIHRAWPDMVDPLGSVIDDALVRESSSTTRPSGYSSAPLLPAPYPARISVSFGPGAGGRAVTRPRGKSRLRALLADKSEPYGLIGAPCGNTSNAIIVRGASSQIRAKYPKRCYPINITAMPGEPISSPGMRSAKAFFSAFSRSAIVANSHLHNRSLRSRSALPTTDTELSDIARAAMTGLSKMPRTEYRTPAAIGTPSAL
jgi:hypothetical protein